MEYRIQTGDELIEASFSSRPDDLSLAAIRIVAEPKENEVVTLIGHLEIAVKVYTGASSRPEDIPEDTLTSNPSAIVPQVSDHGDWELAHQQDGVFRATPRPEIGLEQGESAWVFALHDIEVVNRVGRTKIVVTEYDDAGSPTKKPELWVRKVSPELRIDYFRAVGPEAGDHGSVTTSIRPVTLEWATSGATAVALYGPTGQIPFFDAERKRVDGSSALDHAQPLQPDTTGTYTLVAESPRGHVVRQLTTTVTDQTKVRGNFSVDKLTVSPNSGTLTVGSGEAKLVGEDSAQGAAELSVSDRGALTADDKQALVWWAGKDETNVQVDNLRVTERLRVDQGATVRNSLKVQGDETVNGSDTALEVVGSILITHGTTPVTIVDGKIDGRTISARLKKFVIPHPLGRGRLQHSCVEGPEAAVYYRGEAELFCGRAVVELPDYFEALTRPEGRTVTLTAKGSRPYLLSYDDVADGQFTVFGTVPDGVFCWEVKAVRADVDPLAVEVEAE